MTYDARGHGASTRRPQDMTRAACVRDAVAFIRELSLAPVTLTGQSLGGLTALLTAAAHPELVSSLVSSLVLTEAGPSGSNPDLPSEPTEMQARRPATEVVVIPDASHDVHLDQPEHLHEAVAALLARCLT